MNITLEGLEKEFGFEYPPLYKHLAGGQMPCLDGASEHHPRFFYWQDFELMRLDEIREEISAMKDPDDYREINPDYLFVPFGRNGAGDLYCFWYRLPDEIQAKAPLVAMLWHDDNRVDVLAKNFEDFIFRELASAVCNVHEKSLLLAGSFKANITNMLNSHEKFISAHKSKAISELYGREWHKSNDGNAEEIAGGLIAPDELEVLLQQEIGFEYLNRRFEYEAPVGPAQQPVLHRVSGTACIRLPLAPEPSPAVLQALQALNWRRSKAQTAQLEYTRKFDFFTKHTAPECQFRQMLEPFLERLEDLKKLTRFELIFVDDKANATSVFEVF